MRPFGWVARRSEICRCGGRDLASSCQDGNGVTGSAISLCFGSTRIPRNYVLFSALITLWLSFDSASVRRSGGTSGWRHADGIGSRCGYRSCRTGNRVACDVLCDARSRSRFSSACFLNGASARRLERQLRRRAAPDEAKRSSIRVKSQLEAEQVGASGSRSRHRVERNAQVLGLLASVRSAFTEGAVDGTVRDTARTCQALGLWLEGSG